MISTTYYTLKPLIPRKIQIYFRRILAQNKRKKFGLNWPIDPKSAIPPEYWQGWPMNKKFALVLSHDVDTQKGHDRVLDLLALEKSLGFRSAFNFVPERYNISKELINRVKQERFEVNVHGLKHDGRLFKSKKIFQERSQRINQYLRDWGSEGFTAPSMICNLEWIHDLNIGYGTCTFDTDPFEPVPKPSKTIFPFAVNNSTTGSSYIELPYTLPQDHTLFIILQESDISIWKKKLAWIVDHGGMVLLNSHPDYMRFPHLKQGKEEYPIEWYKEFLMHVYQEFNGQYWHALPSEVAKFFRSEIKAELIEDFVDKKM